MTAIDLDHLRTSIGKSHADEDAIAARHAALMAAAFDHEHPERISDGEPLPPLWHWIYFLEGLRSGELGRDRRAARGAFLPAVPLARSAEQTCGRALRDFPYRGLCPALRGDALTLSANLQGDRDLLAARLGDGTIWMQADAGFAWPANRAERAGGLPPDDRRHGIGRLMPTMPTPMRRASPRAGVAAPAT